MQIVLREALGPARMFGFAQLAEGIAVQIPDFHDVFSSLFLLQQLQQFLWFHGQDRSVCRAGDRLGKVLLCLLQLHDLFFNGVLRNELVHLHRIALADAVGAVGGLILRSHVPPWVVVDDDICRRQVQAGAARPQRDEEHVRRC